MTASRSAGFRLARSPIQLTMRGHFSAGYCETAGRTWHSMQRDTNNERPCSSFARVTPEPLPALAMLGVTGGGKLFAVWQLPKRIDIAANAAKVLIFILKSNS